MRVPSPRSFRTILGKRVGIHHTGFFSDGVCPATFDIYTERGTARVTCFYGWQAFNEARRLITAGLL